MSRAEGRRKLLGTLLALSIPTMVEEILATLLQYVDTAMVGRLGEQATAAVSITTTINPEQWAVGTENWCAVFPSRLCSWQQDVELFLEVLVSF